MKSFAQTHERCKLRNETPGPCDAKGLTAACAAAQWEELVISKPEFGSLTLPFSRTVFTSEVGWANMIPKVLFISSILTCTRDRKTCSRCKLILKYPDFMTKLMAIH